jgi:hypothetical protein
VGTDIPVGNAVKLFEQGPVEHLDRRRVGEVDALLAIRVDDHKGRQLRAGLDQRGEVITALVTIARVQLALGCIWLGRRRAWRSGFLAGAFGWREHGLAVERVGAGFSHSR